MSFHLFLLCSDIGGVTAEEVNAISLKDLLKAEDIPSFGWGEADGDHRNGQAFAREGTFIVATGAAFAGASPPCIDSQTDDEASKAVLPYLQYGNDPADPSFFGIASMVVPKEGFEDIKVIAAEFATGAVTVGVDEYDDDSAPIPAYNIKLYDADGVELTAGFNDLVAQALDLEGPSRGDPRLFKYPNGEAGVFIERTGVFYKLEEIELDSSSSD